MHWYNEIDPFKAAWLRSLIAAGHLPDGIVDERSILDITPADLAGFTQCHFFAGIGGWSLALRLAGWPDDRPVWTGSCPCQPFSSAGQGAGFADERHLWPYWFHLVSQRRPPVILGEQVASGAAAAWCDLVQDDLEGVGYAFGAVPIPAAGIAAPHIRDRLWWVANATGVRPEPMPPVPGADGQGNGRTRGGGTERRPAIQSHGSGALGLVANPNHPGQHPDRRPVRHQRDDIGRGGHPVRLVNPGCQRDEPRRRTGDMGRQTTQEQGEAQEWQRRRDAAPNPGPDGRPSPLHGLWQAADWLLCRDGKWRPVEPGTFPLAHGLPNRMGRLRGYGDAIVPQVAAEFIKAALSLT